MWECTHADVSEVKRNVFKMLLGAHYVTVFINHHEHVGKILNVKLHDHILDTETADFCILSVAVPTDVMNYSVKSVEVCRFEIIRPGQDIPRTATGQINRALITEPIKREEIAYINDAFVTNTIWDGQSSDVVLKLVTNRIYVLAKGMRKTTIPLRAAHVADFLK
tara:strand:- start:7882 stop:8376 length:495 start_codon:yes stop_codon:yes gene_type:complete